MRPRHRGETARRAATLQKADERREIRRIGGTRVFGKAALVGHVVKELFNLLVHHAPA